MEITAVNVDPGGEPALSAQRYLDALIRHVDRAVINSVHGRRAARALAEWVQPFGLAEVEFYLLWRLRSASKAGVDQTTIAKELAFSSAQVSATVERLRARGCVLQQTDPRDRRRNLWSLSATGQRLLDELLSTPIQLRYENLASGSAARELSGEAAA